MNDRFIRGKGSYLPDLDIPGMLHVSFVRSQLAHARIKSMTLASAEVEHLITGKAFMKNIFALGIEGKDAARYDWFPLSDHAYYVGEPIGMVYANTLYEAEDLKTRVDIEYEELPPVTDIHSALSSETLLHKEVPHNVLFHRYVKEGATRDAFEKAYIVLEHTFHYGRQTAVPLDGRGVIAQYYSDTGALKVWTSTQIPWAVRLSVAQALGMDVSRVRVIRPDVGGAFGQKGAVYAEEIAVPWLAVHLGKPVKWVEDRSENLIAAQPSHESEIYIKVAADREGRLLAVKARILSDCGAHHPHPLSASVIPATASTALFSVYRVEKAEVEIMGIATNKATMGSYRGVGMNAATFATERMMDILAHRLGIDPAELRLRNLLTEEEFPYEGPVGQILDSGDYRQILEVALDAFQYWNRRSHDKMSNGKFYGIGIGCLNEHSGTGSRDYAKRGVTSMAAYDAAKIRVLANGKVEFFTSTASSGQGHRDLISRLVSEKLGITADRVIVYEADTGLCPEGFGTGVDRSAIAISGVVAGGCDRLLKDMGKVALSLLKTQGKAKFSDGRFVSTLGVGESVSFDEVLRAVTKNSGDGSLVFEATHISDLENQVFSNGAHIALVEVDPDTALVRVLKYVVAADCGRILDRESVRRQIIGGIAQGIGMALLEEMQFDESGQVMTGSLMDYLVPLATDMADTEVHLLEHPSPFTPGGVKGVGQMGAVASGAAIGNAVADALGLKGPEPDHVPITPERVYLLLRVAGITKP